MERVDLGVCESRFFPADPNRAVVVLPGAHYLPSYPLLWFTRETAASRGGSVLGVWDELGEADDPETWVQERSRQHSATCPRRAASCW